MNNYVRQKVHEWLLKITANSTVLDRQHYEKSQINLSINDKQIELTTNMEMGNDAKNFFSKFNLSEFNITAENFDAFLQILNISKLNYSKPHPLPKPEIDSCVEYCSGSFHDALEGYKSFHGYISLVVSVTHLQGSIQFNFVLCYRCVYSEQ